VIDYVFINKLIKKIKDNQILFAITNQLTYILLRFMVATYRLHVSYDKSLNRPLGSITGVFCAWHQNIIASTVFFKKNNSTIHCIVSPSKDGEFVGAIAQKLGFKVLYGSSHKEPIALVRQSIRVLKETRQLFLIGDGSRGPSKQLQPGVIYLSQKANVPVIFIDCDVQWKLTLKKSWDKFQIPLPFSKIFITLHIR